MTTLWYAIIYAGLLILTVSASKSDILKTTKVSWISMENLKSMLIVSFNSCSCCNVFIDGESVMTEHFFNGFIKTYSGGYTLNRPTYVCSEYLMIFSSADRVETAIRSAPTKTAILEVLIVVTNDDEELTRALNVSLFGIANVNVATFNGLWTLSENFLTPRIFKKVSSHREITHERRTVNLRGREVRATAYYKPPYCHIRTTVNRTINGVTREYFIPKNNSELDGIDMKIFILIAERLNFTWNIRKPINPHHWLANQTLRERYGMSNGTHWIGGMIGELNHKEVDIAFTSVWVSVDKLPFTNLTKSWAMIRIRFLVPRPKPSSSFWALTRPLSNEVWSAILAMLAIKSIYVYTSAWVNPRIPTSNEILHTNN